jgi:hypothetical protein
MKKDPQAIASPGRQEKPKARVPFFALQLKRETLRSISAGDDDLELARVRAAEKETKI